MFICIHFCFFAFFCFLFFFFCMSNYIFVLFDQGSDLPGHISFQKKKRLFAAQIVLSIIISM